MAIDINSDQLEPDTPALRDGTSNDALVVLAYSQAISLKRIADSLAALAKTDDTYNRNIDAMRAAVPGGTDWSAPPTGKEYTADNAWIDWPGVMGLPRGR